MRTSAASVLLCMLLGLTMVSCGVSTNSGGDVASEDTRKDNSDTTAVVRRR
ncbi:MAG: hypothetical protein K2J11_00020 [Oscillospiraceae bacterium]|nr:hypothetical protein [Oscillospiraceae bacterium]